VEQQNRRNCLDTAVHYRYIKERAKKQKGSVAVGMQFKCMPGTSNHILSGVKVPGCCRRVFCWESTWHGTELKEAARAAAVRLQDAAGLGCRKLLLSQGACCCRCWYCCEVVGAEKGLCGGARLQRGVEGWRMVVKWASGSSVSARLPQTGLVTEK